METQPLFLPKGSIRAILILMLTGFILASLFYGKEIPEYVIIIWSGGIGLYFGDRISALITKKNEQQQSDSSKLNRQKQV